MARNTADLVTLAKTSVDNNDYIAIENTVTGRSKKIQTVSLFPSLSTTGVSSEQIYINITNKNQLNFKGIKSGDTGLLTVATNANNIEFTVLEAGIDLSKCDNSTAGFLSGVDFTGTITGENTVIHGGTGLSTIAKGAILYADATDSIAAASTAINGQILVHNSVTGVPAWSTLSAGDNLTLDVSSAGVLKLDANLATLSANLDTGSYNIDLDDNYISSTGSDGGIRLTGNNTYIGASGDYHNTDVLNIGGGGIRFSDSASVTIKPNDTSSSTAGQPVTIEAGSSTSGNAGKLTLKGGTAASGGGNGGDVEVYAGSEAGGTAGSIKNYVYNGSGSAVEALTITGNSANPNVTVGKGNLVITEATKGIIHTGSLTGTQATDHTTGVTINATSGIITLAAVALNAATNAEFTFTNSTIKTDSVILLTMQDANTTNNAQLTCALVSVGSGSCVISIHNPAATGATSATASKIHFLVINNS